jgi:transforming growth factor-beta-induced protein
LVAALARTSGEGDNDLLAAASAETGDLTVFAPTDAAFEELYTALGVDGVDEIPLETLIAVLKHHIVGARAFSTDLSSGAVTTLNGDDERCDPCDRQGVAALRNSMG